MGRLENNEPKLERNSNLWEWKWMYLEQEADFISGNKKSTWETKKNVKYTEKKHENLMIKQ